MSKSKSKRKSKKDNLDLHSLIFVKFGPEFINLATHDNRP